MGSKTICCSTAANVNSANADIRNGQRPDTGRRSGDMDGDGKLDWVTGNIHQTNSGLLWRGTGGVREATHSAMQNVNRIVWRLRTSITTVIRILSSATSAAKLRLFQRRERKAVSEQRFGP